MPLNLEQRVGEFTREYSMVGMESYEVYAAHPAYQFIWHTVLSINAMAIAVLAIESQQVDAESYLSLACKAHDLTVHLPAYGIVKHVKEQPAGDPPWIQMSLVWRKEPGKNDGWAIGIRRWMWLTVAAGFVDFFEQHQQRSRRRNHELAQMAMVIRDSCAHGLLISSKKSGGAKLDGLKILREDHGKPLSDFIGLGDFFVLALRMFNGPKILRSIKAEKEIEKLSPQCISLGETHPPLP